MIIISRCIVWLTFMLGLAALPCGLAADFTVVNVGATDYRINGVNDPTLTLFRGQTYTFSIAATGHPFWIKTNAVTGTAAAYQNGVSGNGITSGTLTFAVPLNAPDSLIYICQFHSSMQGTLMISNAPSVPAFLSKPRWSAPGQISFDVSGTAGRLHVVEASTNLAGGWAAIGSNSPSGGSFTFTDTNAGTFTMRFYRVTTQ